MKQSEKINKKPLTLTAIIVKNLALALLAGSLAFIFFVFIWDTNAATSFYTMLAVITCAIFGILIFFGLTAKRLTYLKRLKTSAQAMAIEENVTPIPLEGRDELREVAASINLLAEQLQAQKGAVSHLKDENQQLITSISSELYPLITTLNGYLERMLKDPEADPAYLQTVIKKATDIQRFVENVLNNAFSDQQASFYEFKLYEGLPLINELLAKISTTLSEAEFEIIVENCLDQPFSLWIDYQQLSRILSELTTNLIKFADAQKPIHLGLIRNKNELLLIIRNKTLPYAEEALVPESESLTLCQKIIERHQGRIDYYHLNQMFKVELALPIHSKGV
ncbi:HAMP domain-containing sensor histidine kinase [Eubacteriaceae bacterium ES2]|nr:HAMP domain-containing sensor histidine kinase [Eubacteriaceae bacterium ES2]